MTFAGLKENQVNTKSLASFQLGLQLQPIDKFFTTLRANVGVYDFAGLTPDEWTKSNLLSGYSISAGYRSILGPIELSILYNDQHSAFSGYVILGFSL